MITSQKSYQSGGKVIEVLKVTIIEFAVGIVTAMMAGVLFQ
jgi:hypothetical protein